MTNLDDNQLLTALRRSDTQAAAYKELYLRYFKTLCIQAFDLVGDRHAGEDIVMDVFKKVWKLKSFMQEDIHSFRAYLMKVCHNLCIDHLEKRKKEIHGNKTLQYAAKPSIIPQYPDFHLLQRVHRVLRSLPQRRQQAVHLVLVQQLSHEEAAARMGVATNTLNNLYYKGIATIQASFGISPQKNGKSNVFYKSSVQEESR